jgi:transcription initiation factor TFIIF subunit alpha
MKHLDEDENGQVVDAGRRRRLKTVDGSTPASRGGEEIDYDEEFADDEEAPIMEGAEEDVKAVEDKIKKELRAAPVIGPQDEDDDRMDDLFGDDEPKMGKEGRKLKKYLRSLEKNTYYDSDDDENPYASEESDSDSIEQVRTEDKGAPRSVSPGARSDLAIGVMGNGVTQFKPLVKKEFKNLPPGMVILQLQPHVLAGFPRDVWNPNAKRRRESSPAIGPGSPDSDAQAAKKIKIEDGSATGGESGVLTEEDVRSIIETRQVSVPELLSLLKPKLKKHQDNQKRLRKILRSIARLQNDVLVMKAPNQS